MPLKENFKHFYIILMIFFGPFNTQAIKSKCDKEFGCITSISQKDCKKGEFLVPAITLDKCCPGCKGGKQFDESCSKSPCAPGLECVSKRCTYDKSTCLHVNHIDKDLVRWVPKCNLDGTYAAKQCRGDKLTGRCFCYSETGQRIFGWDWFRNAENMTCACSHRRSQLEAEDRIVTLHCEENGNYKELQCDSGICWCVEQKSGKPMPGTPIVHHDLWELLPCYNATIHGHQYLRQCESASVAQKKILQKFKIHGTTKVQMNNIQCDYDGSYGNYLIDNGIVTCTWKNGTKIGSYYSSSSTASKVNCNCARDQVIFEEAGLTLTLGCSPNGNYETLQDQNGQSFCVDQNGFVAEDELMPGQTDCSPFIYDSKEYQ